MKKAAYASILALTFISLAARDACASSASGSYQFSFDEASTKSVEFSADGRDDGTAAGSLFLTDDALITYQDVDGTREPGSEDRVKGFYIKAELDSLVVEKNQAVMGGVVRDSNILDLIGRRVLLTVADNGDNTKVLDAVTWGLYKPIERKWTPADAELKEDPGVGLTWWATDYERKDDVGYKMPRDETAPVTTQTFPIASYAPYPNLLRASGDIVVRP